MLNDGFSPGQDPEWQALNDAIASLDIGKNYVLQGRGWLQQVLLESAGSEWAQ